MGIIDKNLFREPIPCSISELASLSNCEIHGSAGLVVEGVCTIENAKPTDITFLSNNKYAKHLKSSNAGACILSQEHIAEAPGGMTLLISDNPYYSYAQIVEKLYPNPKWQERIEPSAIIADDARIGKGCYIGHNVVIEQGVEIGENCYIGHNTTIACNVKLGAQTSIHNNVTLCYCVIGNRCVIKSGARIGQEGFGFAPGKAGVRKVQQVGQVILADDVEIGANTCVDRGAIDNTVIGMGTKIDNLVQIGHNVQIGMYCFVAGHTGIAGSTIIGNQVKVGGQSGFARHLKVGDNVSIAGQAGVFGDIEPNQIVGGTPAVPISQWHRQNIYLKKAIQKKRG